MAIFNSYVKLPEGNKDIMRTKIQQAHSDDRAGPNRSKLSISHWIAQAILLRNAVGHL